MLTSTAILLTFLKRHNIKLEIVHVNNMTNARILIDSNRKQTNFQFAVTDFLSSQKWQ